MTSNTNDANQARETQQPAPLDPRVPKAAETAFMAEQSSQASAIARHCQQESDSTHNSGDYSMQRWLNESSQEGPWSAVVAHAESANSEKIKARKEQELLSKHGNGNSPASRS